MISIYNTYFLSKHVGLFLAATVADKPNKTNWLLIVTVSCCFGLVLQAHDVKLVHMTGVGCSVMLSADM